MKIVIKLNEALIIAILLLLVTVPIASAEYAVTTVYFNIPSDTSFTIQMPSVYASNEWDITATTEATANETDWISFNFTQAPQSDLQEPLRVGTSDQGQSGSGTPIMLLKPAGNLNLTFSAYINETIPTGVELYINATCYAAGYCQNELTTLTAVTSSATTLATDVDYSDANGILNVTLYANTTASALGGQSSVPLLTNTSAS